MSEYTPHAPERWNMLSSIDRERFGRALQDWREIFRSIMGPEEKPLSVQVGIALKNSEFGPRDWLAIEDTLLIEKHGLWTSKAIARQLKREPVDVLRRIGHLRRIGIIKANHLK